MTKEEKKLMLHLHVQLCDLEKKANINYHDSDILDVDEAQGFLEGINASIRIFEITFFGRTDRVDNYFFKHYGQSDSLR